MGFFFRPKRFTPFNYPDGEPIEVGDALMWGTGGFYPGRVLGFVRGRGCAPDHADALRIDEGKPVERVIDAAGFKPDDVRRVERRTRDHKAACLRWLTERIAEGNAHSMYVLGCLLNEGHTAPKNAGRAAHFFERAIEHGHPLAMVELALLLDGGAVSGQREPMRAISLMQRAAAAGMPSAREWLSAHLTAGMTPPEQFSGEAMRIAGLQLGAQQGDADAMCALAEAHERGAGVPLDYALAAHWYARAAEKGSRVAVCNLADKYEKGLGVAQDLARAVQLYELAASLNVLAAQFSLGEMYRDGRGVPRDLARAREYLQRAASQGFAPARAALDRLPQ